MDGTLPKISLLKLEGREGSNNTLGLDGGRTIDSMDLDHNIT